MIRSPEQIAREAAERLARVGHDNDRQPGDAAHFAQVAGKPVSGYRPEGELDGYVEQFRQDIAVAVLAAIREDRGRPVTPSSVDAARLAEIAERDEKSSRPDRGTPIAVIDRRDLLAHVAHQDAVIADLSRTVAAFSNDSDCFREGVREGLRRAIEVTQARMGQHLFRAAEYEKLDVNM